MLSDEFASCAHIGRAKDTVLAFVLRPVSQDLFMSHKLSHGQMTENGAVMTFARKGMRTSPLLQYKKTESLTRLQRLS